MITLPPIHSTRYWPLQCKRIPSYSASIMRRDLRSPEAALYRSWYKKAVWLKARAHQLATHPLCIYCQQEGKIVPATVVNHRKPHKGDWQLFIDPANHESTCAHHHNSLVQSYERTGRMKPVIGIDGWPQPTP